MAKKNKWWDSIVKGTTRALTPIKEEAIISAAQNKSQENANSQNYGNLFADTWNSMKSGVQNFIDNSAIGAYKKTKENMEAEKEQQSTNEIVVMPTPSVTMNEESIRNLYPSLYAPDLTNGQTDHMQGWRGTMSAINNKYGGDILGYANTDAFNALSSSDKAQYYQDVGYFNNLYNTVNAYDTDITNEQRKAREAEEYANTRQRLMQKYIPETLAAMGYANTGLASDALMSLNNRYENYALDAKQQSEQNQSDLLNQYRKQANNYMAERSEQELKDLQTGQENYDSLVYSIYSDVGEFNPSLLDAALEMNKITQEQYDKLMGLYNTELDKYKTETKTDKSEAYKNIKAEIINSPETFDFSLIEKCQKVGDITEEEAAELTELYKQENPLWQYANGLNTWFNDDQGKQLSGTVTLINGGWGKFIENASSGLTPDEVWANKDTILAEHNGKSGGKRDNPLYDAVQKAKQGKLQNGAIIDINYGENDDKRSDMVSYVIYMNGKFYPVTYSGTPGSKLVVENNALWGGIHNPTYKYE